MKRKLLLLFLAGISAPAFPKTLYIGIDESTSSPVATDPASARVAAGYLRGEVAALQPGDFVRIRTFADRSSAHAGDKAVQIDRKHKADTVAADVARYVAAFPSKPHKGQGESQILAFLELSDFGCAAGAKVILLTDGVESSPGVREKGVLAGKKLPAPPAGVLKGCEVVMFGLGQSASGKITRTQVLAMRKAWTDYMRRAGASFTPITNP